MRRNASSCILSSEGITMYSCRMVAAVAASTGARPRGRHGEHGAAQVVAHQPEQRRVPGEILARGLERRQHELQAERAHALRLLVRRRSSVTRTTPRSGAVGGHRTPGRREPLRPPARTRSSSRAVAVASSVASPETRAAPFVGDRGREVLVSGGDEGVAGRPRPPPSRGTRRRCARRSPRLPRAGAAACRTRRARFRGAHAWRAAGHHRLALPLSGGGGTPARAARRRPT